MIVKHIVVGMLQTNCWALADEKTLETVIFDPGTFPDRIMNMIESNHFDVKLIVMTHGHFDHVMAAREVQKRTGARCMICRLDEGMLEPSWVLHRGYMKEPYEKPVIDRFLYDGDSFTCGSMEFRVMRTPGHTSGSCCFLCDGVMVSGDTLFADCCGRTDLGGNEQDMMLSLRRLYELEGDYRVLPGHGPETVLSRERANNPYMRSAVGL